MRFLLALLTLLLPAAARATPAGFAFQSPTVPIGVGTPFFIDLHRTGDWDEAALKAKAAENRDYAVAWVSVALDGTPLASLPLAHATAVNFLTVWNLPLGWRITVPALNFGTYQLTASYVGDTVNTPAPAVWDFALVGPAPTLPTLFPTPKNPLAGFDPILPPTGFITLTDLETQLVTLRPIETLLITDPQTGRRVLDLAVLPHDTVITYPGDANTLAFNFTYDAPEPIPAPAAPLPLALLALAALRLGRPRLLHSSGPTGAAPCRMPISSTCASIPAIR